MEKVARICSLEIDEDCTSNPQPAQKQGDIADRPEKAGQVRYKFIQVFLPGCNRFSAHPMRPAPRAESFGDGGELFRLFDLKKGFVGHPAAPVEQARLLNDPLRQIDTWPDQGESRRFPRNVDQLSSDRNPLIAHLDGIPDLNSILLHGRLLQKGRPALLISEGGLCWQSFQLSVKGERPVDRPDLGEAASALIVKDHHRAELQRCGICSAHRVYERLYRFRKRITGAQLQICTQKLFRLRLYGQQNITPEREDRYQGGDSCNDR